MKRRPSERIRREAREIAAALAETLDVHAWAEDGIVFVEACHFPLAVEACWSLAKYGYNPHIPIRAYA